MKKRNAALVLTLAMALTVSGCKKQPETEATEPPQTETETVAEIAPTIIETESETEAAAVGTDRSYLTGEVVGEDLHVRRPFAVMMNNIINAVPQAGIEQAGVVYEAPVEGAITRLMAIFDDVTGMEKIGAVRSCRTYYPMFANEFDAIYVHYGQAVYAVELLNSDKVNNISGLAYQEGAGDIYGYAGESIFYRTSDRPAPHNCYTSGTGIDEACNTLGYRRLLEDGYEAQKKFTFAGDNEKVSLDGGTATTLKPGYQVNEPWFEYRDGKYYRYQYGDAQIDELTGEQLAYTNVIFQLCPWENYDDHGYLNIDTISGGDAYYFTNGTFEKCTWSRAGADGTEPSTYMSDDGTVEKYRPAKYYDEDGNEIVLNQGKTWICIIQDSYADDIVIE